MQTSHKVSRLASIGPNYAPPSKDEQIATAESRGPADELELEQLAQFCDGQSKTGVWHYGYMRAHQLRLLARSLSKGLAAPSPSAGLETIEALEYHANQGGVHYSPDNLRALARLLFEYETSLAYALRRLEQKGEEVQTLQRTVADLAEQVEVAEAANEPEPITFFLQFGEDADPQALGIEQALELVTILDILQGE